MILTIDKGSADPIYLQIRNQVVAAIAKGDLVQGDSLPSVRNLARDLGVNLHTVNKAYAVLQDEGYAVMSGRKGTAIAVPSPDAASGQLKDVEARTLAALRQLALDYRASGGRPDGFVALASAAVLSDGEGDDAGEGEGEPEGEGERDSEGEREMEQEATSEGGRK